MSNPERLLIIGSIVVLTLVVALIGIQNIQIGVSTPSSPVSQQVVGTISVPSGLFTSNISGTQKIDIILTFPFSVPAPTRQETPQYLTIILAGFFTLLGSATVLVYNYIAADSTRKFEWGKYMWDKYQASYLELRDVIRGTTDPSVIENQVRNLGYKIILPSKLEKGISALITNLHANTTEQEKNEQRESVLKEFDGFVDNPWKYL